MIGKTNADGNNTLDLDALTATPGDVISGQKFGGSGSDDIQIGSLTISGNATDNQVLSGYTYYNNNVKAKRTGTMANQGGKTASLNCGASYTIPAGYHNGSGKITANTLSVQTGGVTAADGDVLSGKTFWRDGAKRTGSLVNRGAINHSLGINGSYTIPSGYHNGNGKITQSISTQGGSTTTPGVVNKTLVSANRYVTGNIIVSGDANLKAENIRKGISIFGITGTADVYDRTVLYLINGNTINSLIGGTLNYASLSSAMGSFSKTNDNGLKFTVTGYGLDTNSKDKYYHEASGRVYTAPLPIKKGSFSKLRMEWEEYTVGSMGCGCIIYLSTSPDITLINNSTYRKFSGSKNQTFTNGTTSGTIDFDISSSSISTTTEFYLHIQPSSHKTYGSSHPGNAVTGSYIKIKKLYFTN